MLGKSDHHNYFILIKVKGSKNKHFEVVLENEKLFKYLFKKKLITNKKEYIEFVKKILKNNEELNVKDINKIAAIGEIVTDEENEVEVIIKSGKDYFINYYFKDKIMKEGISSNKKKYIIKHLFEFQIPCYTDDESGFITIKPIREIN